MCTDGQPRTSCGPTRTATDILCVLNRQPMWAKITQTVHGKGQRAESKDQRTDMCTDGQPHKYYVLCVLTETHGHTRTATDVLCVLTDIHRRPFCADGHPRASCTAMDCHGRRVCAGRHPQTSCVHGHPVYSPHGPKSPEQSTGRVSVLSPRTNMLICVLMDTHVRYVCADRHTRTHTDKHGFHVCADRHPQMSCPTWAKITRTVHRKGQRAESKDQRADMSTDVLCVLTDTQGHTRTHTDSHKRHVCADGQPQTATDVLCVLADTHGRPVHPTWAKATRTVHGKGQRAESKDQLHGKGQRAESKDQRTDMCTDGQPHNYCVC
ncbi:unnamed protein product [Brassica rapa]|uniref:Uncharacterized protein n=1 Tax=Brassica campestris TaxID=3711 RepID=A0A8D9D7E2_BRACM|nr:unnamed protein product [Brassica rapa]